MLNYLVVFVFGAVVGSFLNVCIYRIPRGESLILPGSRCPNCKERIAFYDNIPILSYLFLKGRCRNCGFKISLRYPIVELLNGLFYTSLYSSLGLGATFLAYSVFLSSLIVVTFIDLDHQIVPDRITIPGIILGILLASTLLPVGLKNSLSGALLGGGLFYLTAILSRGGMGGGDIKLIAMIGAFLGWKEVLLTIFLGALSGSLVGVFLMVFRGKGRKHKIPFGPFLSLGATLSLFWGKDLIKWYLNL
jgi:leader peptidase (prepilin peptidase)/N-methyltransferase